jgi:MoaE-MoaD fusion protein
MYSLTTEPIDLAALRLSVAGPEDGAIVVFEGTVRNHSRGRSVLRLEYQAYESMAMKKLEEVGSLARRQFDIRQVSIIHRLGPLEVGDCSVAIAVAAAHRGPAFEACRFAIDTLKKIVPIWKKEHYSDGEVWIEGGN